MTTHLAVIAALSLTAQPSLRIIVIEGEGAVNIIQQKTAVAPVVEVRDQNNVPVAGAVVRFTIAGGKQATFAGGTQTITVTTNAAGRAAAAINPLSNGAVQIQVQAAFQGQTAAATIAQTNVMTAAQSGQAAAATASGGGGGGIGGGTIAGIAGGVAAAGAAAVLTQKSAENGDASRRIDAAVQAALGTYVLQTVNGGGLPAITVSSPPATCAVITDNSTLTLTATGTDQFYEVIETSRTDCRLGPNESFRSSSTGTWTISGSTMTFTARSENYLLDAATVSGSTLSMTVRPPHIDAGREAPRVNTVWRK